LHPDLFVCIIGIIKNETVDTNTMYAYVGHYFVPYYSLKVISDFVTDGGDNTNHCCRQICSL